MMKSAYELAMERLQKGSPTITLTPEQKAELAEIDSSFNAKIAERKIFLTDQITKAAAAGKFDDVESLEKQLTADVRRLQEDCEQKKEKLRAPAQDGERERRREHERRAAPPLLAHGELGSGDAGRHPGRSGQQAERLRTCEEVARHAEGQPGVDGAQPAGPDQAGERIRRERRQQVVERDQDEHPRRGRSRP